MSARRPRVVVIDDDEALLEIASLLVEQGGFEAVTLGGGGQRPRVAFEPPPDVVLLDLNMPVAGGDELIRRLRESPSLRDVPVVFFSSNDEAELRTLAARAGAQGYIPKSEMGRDLAAEVARFIPRHLRPPE